MTTLIVIFIIFLIIRLSSRYLFPYLIKRYINKVKQQFEGQQSPGTTPSQSANKIKINYPSRGKTISDPEYTPYEEIIEEDDTNQQQTNQK